jgi:hypothetical protein
MDVYVVRDEINSIPFWFDAVPTLHDIKLAFIILKLVIIKTNTRHDSFIEIKKRGIHFKLFDLENIYGEYKEKIRFYFM